jgi:aryl-alcohol dehydrogenase-like predicted oxidoreductase
LTEAAYRFCRHEPGAEVILTGTGNVEHLEANLAAIQGPPLAPEIVERLRGLFGAVDSVSGN